MIQSQPSVIERPPPGTIVMCRAASSGVATRTALGVAATYWQADGNGHCLDCPGSSLCQERHEHINTRSTS